MIVHLPTVSRWIRSILYLAAISFVLYKATLLAEPYMLPDDPYKIPAGDALSVHAAPSGIPAKSNTSSSSLHHLSHDLIERLKWFYLTGE